MEKLLHYVWQHRLYPHGPLQTTKGEPVEILNPGFHNTDAGPDFFNAQVRIGEDMLAGNVEIHEYSSDWYRHGHDHDPAYNNVILHVIEEADDEVQTQNGRILPQLLLKVPEDVKRNYNELLNEEQNPPCYRTASGLPGIIRRGWLDALCTERLENKTERINHLAEITNGDWERVAFVTLARSFGFGINAEAFQQWALQMPFTAIAKHRDNPLQIEAVFLGQSGLLETSCLPQKHLKEATGDPYYKKLLQEYRFLATKFSLKPIDGHLWRFLRLRPQNFPYIRLVQLAELYSSHRFSLSNIVSAKTIADVKKTLIAHVTPYWETHYQFGVESKQSSKSLSEHSLDALIINAVVPLLFAYGRHIIHPACCEQALAFLHEVGAEQNHIVRKWSDNGLKAENAADSQALIELNTQYCNRKDCLRCRFGWEHLSRTHIYPILKEEDAPMNQTQNQINTHNDQKI